MRVLHLHASTTLGGTELRAFQIVSHLKDRMEIAVLFHASAGPICDYYREQGIPFWRISYPRVFPVIKKIQNFKPDVIHIFGLKTNVLWRPILYALGYRHLVGHIAGLTNQGEKPSRGRIWIDRVTLPFLKVYLCNSQNVADQLGQYGFDRTKLRVIHNGIPIPEPPLSTASHDPPMILSVGNLRPVKGHRYLLEALKILKGRGVSFEACIVGEGPEGDSLRLLAQTYGLQERVRFSGLMKNAALQDKMRQADVFALLSLSEGISGAAMEAMAVGLPVVVTNVGGMNELVSQGEEGFLVPPAIALQAADSLTLLLSKPDLRAQMGHRGRVKIEAKFNLKNTVQEYETFYQNVANG